MPTKFSATLPQGKSIPRFRKSEVRVESEPPMSQDRDPNLRPEGKGITRRVQPSLLAVLRLPLSNVRFYRNFNWRVQSRLDRHGVRLRLVLKTTHKKQTQIT